MSVNPGFGGQSFIRSSLTKLQHVRSRLDQCGASAYLGIDGGIKADNIHTVAKAGADFFVVGSGLFKADNYHQRMQQLSAGVQQGS